LCLSVWQVLCCVCVPFFMGLQVLGVCCAGCHCVRLSVCLWCLRCACGAPCCAVCVAVWQVLPCVVLWVSAGAALWSALMRCDVVAGYAFINKINDLQRFYNEMDYMRFYLPINYSIIRIMSLPLFDYIDYIISIISVLFNFKKTPPSKSFGSSFFNKA